MITLPKSYFYKTITIAMALSFSSYGISEAVNLDCIKDQNDPYDFGYVMDLGESKGACMSDHARPLLQTEDSLDRPIWKDYAQVANISHLGEFYTAEIPIKRIESVIFQLETFKAIVPAAHTQIRLKFFDDSPVHLVNQNHKSENQEVVVHDLILSVEAIGAEGFKYDIFKGLGKNLKTVYRIKTLEGFVKRVVVERGSPVKQWTMRLSDNEKRKLIVNYLYNSSKKGFSDVYNTVSLNCTTELLEIIDKSTNNTMRKSVGRLVTLDLYPSIIKPALIARGLIGANDDIEDLANDPSVAHLLTTPNF